MNAAVNPVAVDTPVIRGARLCLRPYHPEQASERYIGWLNDPEVNAYSRRANHRTSMADAKAYLAGLGPGTCVLAVEHDTLGHIGNVQYGPIDVANQRAEISVLLGERTAWGQGFGKEAVYLVAHHLFECEGLNRVFAGSANPAFLALVAGLGWRVEGAWREHVFLANSFVDWTMVGQLKREFVTMPQFHRNTT